MDSMFRATKAQPEVAEEDLLQGFQQFVRMLDSSFKPENSASITAAQKFVAEYLRHFQNAARTLLNQRQLGTLSWDAIIAATKDSIFFEANPEFLEKHTHDLKYKPRVEHKGLQQFAHSPNPLTSEAAKELAGELIELGIFNKNINIHRLLRLKRGLLQLNVLINGFYLPYQLLLPFLALGCRRLETLEFAKEAEDDLEEDDTNLKFIVLSVLADIENVLPAPGSMERTPAARN